MLAVFEETSSVLAVKHYEDTMLKLQYVISFLAVFGLGIGIVINENCSRGYLPTKYEVNHYTNNYFCVIESQVYQIWPKLVDLQWHDRPVCHHAPQQHVSWRVWVQGSAPPRPRLRALPHTMPPQLLCSAAPALLLIGVAFSDRMHPVASPERESLRAPARRGRGCAPRHAAPHRLQLHLAPALMAIPALF